MAISKRSTIFSQSSLNLVKITTSLLDHIAWIWAQLDQNYLSFTNSQLFGFSNFFLLILYVSQLFLLQLFLQKTWFKLVMIQPDLVKMDLWHSTLGPKRYMDFFLRSDRKNYQNNIHTNATFLSLVLQHYQLWKL